MTCPANQIVPITPVTAGGGHAAFGAACADCPLQAQCTKPKAGRVVMVHPQELALQTARAAQQDPAVKDTYRATRPIMEPKISHLTRQPWVDAEPAAEDQNATSPTSSPAPVSSTWPTSPAKACMTAPPDGPPPDRPGGGTHSAAEPAPGTPSKADQDHQEASPTNPDLNHQRNPPAQ